MSVKSTHYLHVLGYIPLVNTNIGYIPLVNTNIGYIPLVNKYMQV